MDRCTDTSGRGWSAFGDVTGSLRPAGSAKGAAVRFKVVDSVKKLEPRQYERIVCVFVHGPAWQFKGWEWKTPVDIFSK